MVIAGSDSLHALLPMPWQHGGMLAEPFLAD